MKLSDFGVGPLEGARKEAYFACPAADVTVGDRVRVLPGFCGAYGMLPSRLEADKFTGLLGTVTRVFLTGSERIFADVEPDEGWARVACGGWLNVSRHRLEKI